MWGFLLNTAAVVLTLCQYLAGVTFNGLCISMSLLLGCTTYVGGIAWFVAGCMIRWSVIGNVCSGYYYRG